MDTETPRLRLSILGIVVFSLFAALFVRLYYLQIMAPDEGEVEAANNRVRTIQEEAPRGRILDAKGRVLVDNRTSLVVTIDPHELEDLEAAERSDLLLRLAEQLTRSGLPTKVSSIERRLADPQYSPLQPIPVAIDVPEDLMVFLAERADDYPSVQVRRETVRQYPEKSMAAHVVGYVGRISSDELKTRMGTKDEPLAPPKPYEPDSAIGKTGVERTFEDELRGVPGVKKVEVDRFGKVVRELREDYRAPIPGNDLQLSIDMDVQRVTEESLAKQLEDLRGTYTRDGKIAQGKVGSAVVLDPRNGHVIAMASYPTYDPSEFVNGISTERYDQWTKGEPADNPTINRAIAGLYAPGSTFKLVTAYAALEKGLINGTETFYDNGVYVVGNREFQNAQRAVLGPVQLPRALTVSSDVYFYALGDRFWKERDSFGDGIQETARKFGFGTTTGIQLPGELAGVVPDPAWKKQFWESLPANLQTKDGEKWYAGDNVNLAIGQGDVLATPLQMADSYAVFANKGTRDKITVVKRVLKPGIDVNDPALDTCTIGDPGCGVVSRFEETVASHFDMVDRYYELIRQGLGGVTSDNNGGTATELFKGFDQKGWPVLGKTGTAEVAGKADTSLFVGVGPADDPQYVAVAVLEQSGFGSDAAGPLVRAIFEHVSGQADCPDPTTPEATPTTTTVAGTPSTCPDAAQSGTATPGAGTGTAATGGATTTPPTTAYTPPTTAYTPPTTAYRPPTTPSTRAPTTLTPSTLPPTAPTTRRSG